MTYLSKNAPQPNNILFNFYQAYSTYTLHKPEVWANVHFYTLKCYRVLNIITKLKASGSWFFGECFHVNENVRVSVKWL